MRIAVVGIGHMGSWIARDLSREHEVAIYDVEKERVAAMKEGIPLDHLSELGSFAPEMLINSVPLQHTIGAFEDAAESLPSSCILSDIASIKGNLPEYYVTCGFRYASIHPMFGPRFTDLETLRDESVILIKESDATAKEFFREFFEKRNLTVVEYSFEEHDRMMAYSLTLPFVASLLFAACTTTAAVPGTTFKKHEEIARTLLEEDNRLLSEVLFNSFSLEQIHVIESRVAFIADLIKGKNYREAARFFSTLRRNRHEKY